MRQPFAFSRGPDRLHGWIELPDGPGPHPAALWVHGSGTSDVSSWGPVGHHPIFLEAGLAVIAWDKPGCGASSGTFSQSQLWRERADEVLAALAAARCLPGLDPRRIGCFGISQGGWVAPMAVLRDPGIAFAVLLSGPAHRAKAQHLYLIRENLLRSGEDPARTAETVHTLARAIALTRAGAPVAARALVQPYANHPVIGGFMHWQLGTADSGASYDHPNLCIDASQLLEHVRCPVFAAFGELDSLVDWRESVVAYRTALAAAGNADVTISSYPGADHGLLVCRTGLFSEAAELWASGRPLVHPTFSADLRNWLVAHGGSLRSTSQAQLTG